MNLFITSALAVLAASSTGASGASPAPPSAATCAVCHGPSGGGASNGAPPLADAKLER